MLTIFVHMLSLKYFTPLIREKRENYLSSSYVCQGLVTTWLQAYCYTIVFVTDHELKKSCLHHTKNNKYIASKEID